MDLNKKTLRFKLSKVTFAYMGHILQLEGEGLKAKDEKIRTILDMPRAIGAQVVQ